MRQLTLRERTLLLNVGLELVEFLASKKNEFAEYSEIMDFFEKSQGNLKTNDQERTNILIQLKSIYLIIMWIPADTPSIAYDEPRYTATEFSSHAPREKIYDLINSKVWLNDQL